MSDFEELQRSLPTVRRAKLTSERSVLENWLVEVVEKLRDREINDQGIAKICEFFAIEEDHVERESLETELVALRRSSAQAKRALLEATRDAETLIAILQSERDTFKRQADDISQRHAELLLRIGGEQLDTKVASDSRKKKRTSTSPPPTPPPPGRPSLILSERLPQPICCFISTCGQV
ncbi:MAG: hypothetical protein AAF368_03595 [Planctomycetota bacterium]